MAAPLAVILRREHAAVWLHASLEGWRPELLLGAIWRHGAVALRSRVLPEIGT